MANKLITLELLSQYNVGILNTVDAKIAAAIDGLGDVFRVMGRKDSAADLTGVADAVNGDVWLVGAEGADAYEEYYYLNGAWEYMGTTAPTLDGYVTETQLYKGANGDGTYTAPAAGTILAAFKTLVDANATAIDAINNADTGIAAVSKAYTDEQIGITEEKVTQNTTDITTLKTNVGGLGECAFATVEEVNALIPATT